MPFVPALVLAACMFSAGPPGDPDAPTANSPEQTLSFEGLPADGIIRIDRSDRRFQLVVTQSARDSDSQSDGILTDVTREARITTDPPDVVRITETGELSPVSDGTTVITAEVADTSVSCTVEVTGLADPAPVHFANEVVPLFTRLGCNGGGCHGKSGGQNGFSLSLLGFYPGEDFEFLRKEARGRRVFPAAPEQSLLLRKAIGEIPHGGGRRMSADSPEHELLVRWIEQGMPAGDPNAPTVVSIRCVPEHRIMKPHARQQIAVVATLSDGTQTDVTRQALFEPNNTALAAVNEAGLVTALDLSGEVAVMARYQGQVATFIATIPQGDDTSGMPEPTNAIDEAVFAKLRLLGIPPSELCDDSVFLRRVSLDLTGTLPTESEAVSFLEDSAADKREVLVDRLLNSRAYSEHFANKWNLILRNKRERGEDTAGTFLFHHWIRDSLYENKPYDQFVRELLTASGEPQLNPAVIWYRDVDTVEEQVEDTAQLFLGVRIQCARCHHHPFDRWSQNDYYSLAAFFSRMGREGLAGVPGNVRDRRIFHNVGRASSRNPRSGQNLVPAGLGAEPLEQIPDDSDPRTALADWMTHPDNPFFARMLVNRYWKHFFGRGIVEPEDDLRLTNPPANAELLDRLATQFTASGYDLKALVRAVCLSRTYQLSSVPNDFNSNDQQNFSRYYARRLNAESLYDAFHRFTGTRAAFGGMPTGTTARQLVDATGVPYFLKVFGQPSGDTACECERSPEATLAQSLHLLNGKELQQKLSADDALPAVLAADSRPHAERISSLYLRSLTRRPTDDELRVAVEYIGAREDNLRGAYEDLAWAVLNSKEFVFNH